jgi:dihydrofolate synthase / folylpolyglutamate synthase
MTYPDAIRFLYDLRLFGAKFGLENTLKLAASVGNPQSKLRFIHVAGTNGKGSTCAMLESIYRAAGLRVGLFTSPHLVSFRERMQVDRQLVGEADVVRLLERLQPLFKEFPSDHHPTFFEVVTILALLYFEERKCDLVICETGLGGRLDATNIVMPLASVITNVGLDHQQWLGETLASIAAEKAGIIKPNVPVLTATDELEALAVIEQTANRLGAPLTHLKLSDVRLSGSAATAISLPGDHQQMNAALAVKTVEVLQNRFPVDDTTIRRGLETVLWPGRLQLITRPTGQKLLLDGAHNIAGMKALRAAIEKYFANLRPTLVLGVLADKDWQHICGCVAPLAERIFTVPVSSERAADAHLLAQSCRMANPLAEALTCDSLIEALERSAADSCVLVTGSLYLVGEALELLGSPPTGCGERELNEWSAAPVPASTTP